MPETSDTGEIFTGLILLTGLDKPHIAHKLFEALAPFSTSVIDIDHIVINERVILTVLLALSPAHQGAIEADLAELATQIEVDIACLFSHSTPPRNTAESIVVTVQSDKLHPQGVCLLLEMINLGGGEIGAVRRRSLNPLTIAITVLGIDRTQVQRSIEDFESTSDHKLRVEIQKA